MKHIFKKFLRFVYRYLPWGAQEILFIAHCEARGDYKIFSDLAAKFGVVAVRVSGVHGDFEGSIQDQAIIPMYGRTGEWAARTIKILTNFFEMNGNGTYVDVGANIGLITIPIAKISNANCIAFEPEPTNFGYLNYNILIHNQQNNIRAIQLALSDQNGFVTFELSPTNHGDHRIRLKNNLSLLRENDWRAIKVESRRLDDLELDLTGPVAVKIDTQGAEPLVLQGATATLNSAKLVIFEFSPYWMNRMGSDPEVILKFVEDFPRVMILKGEQELEQPCLSGKFASLKLLEIYEESLNVPVGAYWDVICYRS